MTNNTKAERNEESKYADAVAAYVRLCEELKNPQRNREVVVRPKDKPQYTFRYTTLDKILEYLNPTLAKHGFALSWVLMPDGDSRARMTLNLIHESGVNLMSTSLDFSTTRQVRGRNGDILQYPMTPQEMGSLITYYRRYLLSMLPLSPEEDDDGNAASGNEILSSTDRDLAAALEKKFGGSS